MVLKYRLSYLVIAALAIFTSCTEISDKQGNIVETGIVSSDTTNGFVYYLPSGYDGKKEYPVIYLFDPHANGNEPVNKYSAIADNHGYILVGSNVIRNRLNHTEVENLFIDFQKQVLSRFSVETKCQFTGGFSGGAKYAAAIASKHKSIAGVIACGGTIPFPDSYVPDFYYSGIVGTQDFNYLEVMNTLNGFARYDFDFTMAEFQGGHEWPPAESFEKGVIGLSVYSIKRKVSEKNSKWLETTYDMMISEADANAESGNILDQFKILKQADRWFYGLSDVKELRRQIKVIENKPEFRKEIELKKKLTLAETQLRVQYVKAIDVQDLDWWKEEAVKLNLKMDSDKEKYNTSQRLRNYISIACFMLATSDLKKSEYEKAFKKIQVYELVDINNPDVYLMYSKYYMLTGDKGQMQNYFRKSLDKGLKNIGVYAKESDWKVLFNQNEIVTLLNNISNE